MADDPPPFFTPRELKTLVMWHPRHWWQWWREEPVITKIFTALLAVLLAFAIYQHIWGNADVGNGLFALLFVLAALFILYSVLMVIGAAVRYVLRRSGTAAFWQKIRKPVLGTLAVIFWGAIGIGVVTAAWPYLSLDPVKSWYALRNKVPVEHVHVNDKPHDCEFLSAPIGNKNCHYVGAGEVWHADDGTKFLEVEYNKVQD